MVYTLNMVIFHSYVAVYQRVSVETSVRNGGAIWCQREGWWPTITTDHRPWRMDGINKYREVPFDINHIEYVYVYMYI